MPKDYGFPPDVVARFMKSTFDYFITAQDPAMGYPPDGDHLVQAFCWFSTTDQVYPTSNLFDPRTHAISPVGQAFKEYMSRLTGYHFSPKRFSYIRYRLAIRAPSCANSAPTI